MKKLLLMAVAVVAAIAPAGVNAQLLWKVSGNGAKESYLFGSHHIAPVSMLDSVKGLKDAILESDKVYGEVEIGDMMKPENQMALAAKYMMAPADSTLSKVLTVAQMDSLNAKLGELSGGMANASMLETVKPAVVSMQLVMLENMKLFPEFNAQQQLDATVQEFAKSAGVPVSGLESIDDQMKLLYGTPIRRQAEELMECIRGFEKESQKSKEIAEVYISQDFERISKLLEPSDDKEEAKYGPLLYDRNNKWLKTIKEKLPAESMFICVGAGHLAGDKGLVKLLREAGYTVEPIK